MAHEVIGKHLVVEETLPIKPSAKTRRWFLNSRSSGDYLGEISWYSPWRQYNFNPCGDATFNSGCLLDIAAFLKKETQRQKG